MTGTDKAGRPFAPGRAFKWNPTTHTWVKPAKPKNKPDATIWDNYHGWITKAEQQDNQSKEANRINLSYLNTVVGSDPQLKALFKNAVDNNWDQTRFDAAIKGTTWYKTHSDAWRSAEILKAQNKTEYNARLAAQASTIYTQSQNMGLGMSKQDILNLAETAMHSNWNTDQVIQHLAPHINEQNGIAIDYGRQLRQLAASNGVQLNDQWFNSQAVNIARANMAGADSAKAALSNAETDLRSQAASTYATWGDRIKAGENLSDLAAGWVKSAQNLLEDPSITLTDPRVKKALSNVDPNTGQPQVTPIWQFEQQLKSDPQWLKTKNASDTIAQTANSVLKNWGF